MTNPTAPAPETVPTQDDIANSTASTQSTEPAPAAAARVAELTKEAAEFKDKLLRTLAEMENLRRRTEREIADVRTYGISGFARDVLGVADNMRRAIDAIGAELRNTTDAGIKSLIDGVELTERDLLKVMEKHGIRRFDPQGEKFDPNFHQAMFEVPDPNVTAGTVAQVIQAGYKIGERVLRPALVGIAKGGPKPGASPPAEAPASERGEEQTPQSTA